MAAKSISQLQYCGAAAVARKAKASFQDILDCQIIPNKEDCMKHSNCGWVPHAEEFIEDYGLGSCMIKEAAEGISTSLGLRHVFEAHRSAGAIAKPFERAECAVQGDQCGKALTSTGRQCRLCEGIDPESFIFGDNNSLTSICVLSDFLPDACRYFKMKTRNCLLSGYIR